jgi:hypothetical protein
MVSYHNIDKNKSNELPNNILDVFNHQIIQESITVKHSCTYQ